MTTSIPVPDPIALALLQVTASLQAEEAKRIAWQTAAEAAIGEVEDLKKLLKALIDAKDEYDRTAYQVSRVVALSVPERATVRKSFHAASEQLDRLFDEAIHAVAKGKP